MKKLPLPGGVFLIFLTLLLYVPGSVHGETPRPGQNAFFNYLSVNNGLSQNSVTSILQDRKGFIWIGTWDGLNRYDGFAVTVKRHESANPNSLSDNRVRCLYENAEGKILIGTQGGDLNIYDPATDRFTHFSVNKGLGVDENDIKTISSDQQGNTWVGTPDGLRIFHPGTPDFQRLLPRQVVNKILRDKNGNMWIATDNGLYFCQDGNTAHLLPVSDAGQLPVTEICEDSRGRLWLGQGNRLTCLTFEGAQYPYIHVKPTAYQPFPPGNAGELPEVTGIREDLDGQLWISHRTQGLFRFTVSADGRPVLDKQYATAQPFCNIAENSISALLVDRSNVLWAGTFQKGVNYINLSIKKFYAFYPLLTDQLNELGYKGKFVTAICDDGQNVWVGTSDEGLYSYNRHSGQLRNYEAVLGHRWISAIFTARNGDKWIGTSDGLYCGAKDGSLHLRLPAMNIHAVAEDRLGRLWVTTWEGVHIYDPVSGHLRTIGTREGLSATYTFLAYADPTYPVMWISTIGSGLNRVWYGNGDSASLHVDTYRHTEHQASTLNSNYTWSIYRDSSNIMWLGTDAGLDRVQLDDHGAIAHVQHVDHNLLEDRKILAILKDDAQNLWLSNSQGLFRYDPLHNTVKWYSHKDGLQSNTLTEAVYRNAEGIMYVGGINGLNYFDPKEITDNPFPTQLALTGFKIFNQDIKAGEKINNRIVLEKDINNIDRIVLTYRENNFLLTFASLHFALPENNKFRYRLKGYDADWIVTNAGQRFAAYSNLPAGSYDFAISASNNDGRWNKKAKHITIVIQPAPWATWWAKLLYALLLAGAVLLVVRHYRTKHTLREQVYQEKLEKDKVTELNEIKLGFFTNITHELRTPLNLITGPIRELQDKAEQYDHFTRFRLNLIHNNAQRLFSLINQVLDLRKISSENNRLFVAGGDLVKTISDVKNAFNWTATQQQIDYRFTFDRLSYAGWYDKDKIEKVVFNLISNAFKYTPTGGQVRIDLRITHASSLHPVAYLTFRDSGTGIPADEISKIFDMFYQGRKQRSMGSGIGLALSKQLIELHHGSISVNASGEGEGTTFEISFPVGLHSFAPDELFGKAIVTDEANDVHTPGPPVKKEKHKRSILVIEDDEEQLAYIRESIGDELHIYTARNGEEGLAQALRHRPDLVLTDLMMPEMDGIALCRELKSQASTSHIPVLVHSVQDNGQVQREALEAGADDFISKPCDYQLLRLKIHNMLRSDQQLAAMRYKAEIMTTPPVEVADADAALLKQVIDVIGKNIADAGFSVEALCREIGMSRMHLHRRLHDIIGKTASELIRQVRMERAAQLLEHGSLRISEVMEEVGISNYNLFNRYFKDTYGVAPKKYGKEG